MTRVKILKNFRPYIQILKKTSFDTSAPSDKNQNG